MDNAENQARETQRPSDDERDIITPELSELLDDVDPRQRSVIIHSIHQAIRRESFSGPIPHPDLLKGYEEIQRGFAERIIVMAEEEQRHQIRCEQEIVHSSSSQSSRGQWFGFSIAILFLCGAVVLGLYGHDWLAGILGGGTLVSLVAVFLSNRPSSMKKRNDDE